jgi:hypothetical protein
VTLKYNPQANLLEPPAVIIVGMRKNHSRLSIYEVCYSVDGYAILQLYDIGKSLDSYKSMLLKQTIPSVYET